MPDIGKFTYLLSLLEGEAKVYVQGLTSVNYVICLQFVESGMADMRGSYFTIYNLS